MKIWVIYMLTYLFSTAFANSNITTDLKIASFEKNFYSKCSKIDWDKYVQISSNRYAVFVFSQDEPSGSKYGGLGDRLAGLVTLAIFAMRTNRKLIIITEKDDGLKRAFQPKLSNWKVYYNSTVSSFLAAINVTLSDTLFLINCYNPEDDAIKCALDSDVNHRVVVMRSNRAYLCRWVTNPNLEANKDLKKIGIDTEDDLFLIAGCVLQFFLWPTDELWNHVAKFLQDFHFKQKYVSFHFRCGDQSYQKGNIFADDCVDRPGRRFYNTESPIRLGICGSKLLRKYNESNEVFVYISSDSEKVADQINTVLHWPHSILPPKGCHIDHEVNSECTFFTILYWFILTQSDKLVIKSRVSREYPTIRTTFSAFSLYAAVYSLKDNLIYPAATCVPFENRKVSKVATGNWICGVDSANPIIN